MNIKNFCKIFFILNIILSVFYIFLPLTNTLREKEIYLVFRLDDFSESSPYDIEKKIFNIFERNEIQLTVGVIPFIVSEDAIDPSPQKNLILSDRKLKLLVQGINNGSVDIALHGNSHQALSNSIRSEFSGLEYQKQHEKISRAKEYLETMTKSQVNTFAPPWNSYDFNTLSALESLNVETISAFYGQAARDSSLNFLPATCNIDQMHTAIQTARAAHGKVQIIVFLFHVYDFTDHDQVNGIISLRDFEAMIQQLASQDDIKFLSISQAASSLPNTGVDRFLNAKRIKDLDRKLPSFLKSGCTYPDRFDLYTQYFKIFTLYFFIIAIPAIVIACICK